MLSFVFPNNLQKPQDKVYYVKIKEVPSIVMLIRQNLLYINIPLLNIVFSFKDTFFHENSRSIMQLLCRVLKFNIGQ